jgi:hypothetical protein
MRREIIWGEIEVSAGLFVLTGLIQNRWLVSAYGGLQVSGR